MDKKTLFEHAQSETVSESDLIEKHQSLVKEYFKYEEEEKPQVLKDALREQIEKIESKVSGIEEIWFFKPQSTTTFLYVLY